MRRCRGLLALVLGAALIGACAPAPSTRPAPESAPLQILFVGSSHLAWHDAPTDCERLLAAAGRRVHVGRVLKPGRLLDELAADPDVQNAIVARPWDFVVLQGAGMTAAFPDSHHLLLPRLGRHPLEPALSRLARAARERGAEPIYVQPWGFGDGLLWLPGRTEDYQALQALIERNTSRLASRLELTVAPVGAAWRLSRSEHPELPLFADDHVHPSVLGSYLMACVVCRTLLDDLPDALPYHGGVPEHTAAYLQDVARRTVGSGP